MKALLRTLFLTTLFGVIACEDPDPVGPKPTPITCEEAEAKILATCCDGGGNPPGYTGGMQENSMTYQDCDGNPVTVACTDPDSVIANQTIEGDPIEAPNSAACDDAIAEAQEVCPGYEPSVDNAVECPDESSAKVLPSCDDLIAIANKPSRCMPVNMRGWDPISFEEMGEVRQKFYTDPEDVTLSEPPPASTHDDGEQPPDLAPTLVNANQLLRSLRLEIPGNFIRYHLEIALRSGMENAARIDGVKCDPESLRCQINPLALMELDDKLPDGDLSANLKRIDIDGEAAIVVSDLVYENWDPPFPVYASWDGQVIVRSKPMVIDLKKNTRLSLLPTHMPNDRRGMNQTNSYPLTDIKFPDRQKSMIDQALIVTNLTRSQCVSFWQTPSYQTFELPVDCHCPSEEDTEGRGYCITELYPRDVPNAPLISYAINTEHAYLALCTDPMIVKVFPYKTLFQAATQGADPDLTNSRATAPFVSHFNSNAAGKITLNLENARQHVIDFGCSGRLAKYASVGPQITESFGNITGTVGQGTTSAAGLELLTTVDLGGIVLELIPGDVVFGLPFYAEIEDWIRKRFKSFLSWFLKWVARLLGGLIDIDVSVGLPTPGLPNIATLDLGDMKVRVHGVVSHIGSANVDGIEIGVRRLQTNKPTIDRDDWKLDVSWDLANCEKIFAANQSLLDRFKALIGCPFDVVKAAAAIVLGPITTFLGENILEIFVGLTEKLNATVMDTIVTETRKMENGNIIAILLQDAAYAQLLEPYYLQPMGDPVKAAVGTLPAGLSIACGAAPNPSIACALAHLMVGNGMVEFNVDVDILRVGAKTHYRSMQDFENEQPDYCFPPVRHCVVGDNPPGAPAFTEAHRTASQDFNEVHIAEEGGLDWRHQCALFVDFSPVARGYIVTPTAAYEMGIWPSKRTQTLLNEVFVCRNAAHCHPASVPNFLGQRAELAACSIMGDIWGHLQGTNDPYLNQFTLLTTVTEPAGLAALKAVWDAFLNNTQLGDEFNTFDELLGFAASCKTKLEDAGYLPPPLTLPANAFDVGPVYECSSMWLP